MNIYTVKLSNTKENGLYFFKDCLIHHNTLQLKCMHQKSDKKSDSYFGRNSSQTPLSGQRHINLGLTYFVAIGLTKLA